ncbi:MAG TPA: DUF4038 domain-containing protein [Thermoanaerobaculia bacterium]|nr:DUF4038 domain-containing protein [Thermoanaerobaculia bacterium]
MTRRSICSAFAALALAAASVAAPSAAALCSPTAHYWRCWEGSINATAGTLTANPYRDVKLKVTFQKLGQPTLTTYAFWDGGNTFKFRMALPDIGTWTYSTTCEQGCPPASGLVVGGQSVNVTYPPDQMHPLYGHGFLQVAPGSKTLVRALNPTVAFFWLGDTAWSAPVRATTTEWTSYLSDRLSSGFNVIQIATPADTMRTRLQQPTDAAGQTPFEQVPGCSSTNAIPNNCSRWKPTFWSEFDRKIQEANDAGLYVALVGMMERIIETRVDTSNKCVGSAPWPVLTEAEIYARNVAARLSGSYVVFSPSFDRVPDFDPDTCASAGSNACLTATPDRLSCKMRCIGETIKNTVPRHLVTNHYGGGNQLSPMQWFQDQSWLDFQMFQSGQAKSAAGCNTATQLQLITQRPREIAFGLWGSSPPKPVVNGEAIYDAANGIDYESNYTNGVCQRALVSNCLGTTHYNPYRARQAGYLSGLSGATGYTFGVKGIFDWGSGASTPVTGLTWSGGAARRSSDEMNILDASLGAIDEELIPDINLVANQVSDSEQHRKMVAAYRATGTGLMAYLPNNTEIRLNLSGLPSVPRNGHWQNPRTGANTPFGSAVGGGGAGGIYIYTRPSCPATGDSNCAAEPDWILHLP